MALFIGNIFVTAWWKYKSEHQANNIRVFANRLTASTDTVFISFFGLLTLLSGLLLAYTHPMYSLDTLFIQLAIVLWTVSLITWVVSVPYLKKQRIDLIRNQGKLYKYYDRKWWWWGVAATVADVAILPLMIWKPL